MTTPHGENRDRLAQLRSQYGTQRGAPVGGGAQADPQQPQQEPAPQPSPRSQAPLGGVGPQHPQQPPGQPSPPPAPSTGHVGQPQGQTGYDGGAPAPTSYPQQPQPQYQATPRTEAPTAPPQPPAQPTHPAAPRTEPTSEAAPAAPAPSFRAAARNDEIDYFDEDRPYSPDADRPLPDASPAFDEVAVAGREDKATAGFKGWLNRNLGMSLARGEDEIRRDQQIGVINSTIRYPQVIGFYGAKGGVGKSSLTSILGSTISRYRSTGGGMVGIDIDANSSLLSLMEPNTPNPQISSVSRMARDRAIATASDINSHLVFNDDNFAVLPGVAMTDDNPVTPHELHRVLNQVVRNYTLVGLDFPGSPEVPLAMQALHWIDYLVFVVAVSPVSIGNAKRELRRISDQCPALVANATVILNHGGWGSSRSSVQNLDKHVQAIKNMSPSGELEVFEVNYDEHLAEAARLELGRTERSSQDQFLNVAAHIISKLPKDHPNFQKHPLP